MSCCTLYLRIIAKRHIRFSRSVPRRRREVGTGEDEREGEAARNPFQFSDMGQICSIFFFSHFHFFCRGKDSSLLSYNSAAHT